MHYSLSDMILDLLQNSVEAGAREINLELLREQKNLTVRLTDNGCGMTEGELEKAKDPFFTDGIKHKHRRVGLGIPFLIQTVEQTGGLFDIQSEKNMGTSLNIQFDLGNVDTPPEGDWPGLFLQALCFEGDYELIIRRMIISEKGEETGYELRRTELQDILGDFTESGAMLL
ncbi:MAG: ATP-binding protein, partial [Spirochaetales bacterium]|nr:ATP-binding protein [Spirochaetales bacterium]